MAQLKSYLLRSPRQEELRAPSSVLPQSLVVTSSRGVWQCIALVLLESGFSLSSEQLQSGAMLDFSRMPGPGVRVLTWASRPVWSGPCPCFQPLSEPFILLLFLPVPYLSSLSSWLHHDLSHQRPMHIPVPFTCNFNLPLHLVCLY